MSGDDRELVPDLSRRGAESRHGDAVRAMFGRIAPTYDLLNRVLSGGLDVGWRERAVVTLGGGHRRAVLDLCAGTMDLTALLSRRFPAARIVASDFSEEMLDRGRAKAPRAEVVVADAHELPFANGEMDAVVCGFGVRNLSRPARALREIHRVLSPGGVFVTLDFFKPERAPTRALHRAYASVLLPAVGGMLSGDKAAYDYLAKSMAGFLTRGDYEHLLRSSGFERVTARDLTFGVAAIVRAEVPR